LTVDRGEVPGLTLVLPAGLGKDHVLVGLAEAIARARTTIAGRARLFRRRTGECAASGDSLGQALCRGQVLASEEAAATIDEAIVETFELCGQYDTQLAQQAAPDRGETRAGQQDPQPP
jgi:hypothetical protein